MKLSSIDISTAPKHVIVYGAPKVGKTRLALALSERYNIKLLSLEAGHNVAKQFPLAWQERIDVIDIPDTRTNPAATQVMLRLVKMGEIHPCVLHGADGCPICKQNTAAQWNHLVLKELGPNDILVIDSLTQLSNSLLAHIGRGAGDDWKPERDDWAKLKGQIDAILSTFQVAKYNVICISHEELVTTQDEGNKKQGENTPMKLVPVAGSSNSSRNSAKYFDTVVYAEVKNGKHVFGSKTVYANNVLTGDRFGIDLTKEKNGLMSIFDGTGVAQIIPHEEGEQDATPKVGNLIVTKK